ncbi:hypothetical protein [Halobacteriovorax marinus]|uniref:hypothetical protein n=1 Tax=Halobacteriovorax marinus TaxID=97084 RepID=UPI003A939CB2
MSDVQEKYILNLLGDSLHESYVEVLQELGFSLDTEREDGREYKFTLAGPGESISDLVEAQIIYIGESKEHASLFKEGVVAIVPSELGESEVDRTFFKRLLGEDSTLRTSESISNGLEGIGSFKVSDHLNSGFYSDSIAIKAAKREFDFFKVKKALFHLFELSSQIILSDKGSFPLDIDFGVCGDDFFIQAHFPVESFYLEYLVDNFLSDKESIGQIIENVNSLDIYKLSRTDKLVLTCAWSKGSENKAIYIHDIEKFNFNGISKKEDIENFELKDTLDESFSLKSASSRTLELGNIKRIVDFVKMQSSDDITISNLSKFLENYPNKKIIKGITQHDKEEILKVLQSSQKIEEIENSVSKKEISLSNEEVLEKLINKIENLDIDEANEIVSLGLQDYSEAVTRVSGWVDKPDNSKTIISGSREDIGEKTQLIKGSREDLTEETFVISGDSNSSESESNSRREVNYDNVQAHLPKWRAAKDGLIAKLRERVKSDNELKDLNIKDEISSLFQENLNIEGSESNALVKGLLDDTLINSLEVTKEESTSSIDKEVTHLRDSAAKKDAQISRMMKLIDAMKKELIIQKKNADPERDSVAEVELAKVKDELSKKEKEIEILKSNRDNMSEALEAQRHKDDLVQDIVKQIPNNAEIKSFEAKVKTLEAQLEDARERSELLNTKLEQERKDALIKSDEDTAHFRTKMMKSQQVINSFQKENKELSKEVERLQSLQRELDTIVPEQSTSNDASELIEKEKEIEMLNLEVKKSVDQSKALGLKIKQLEQKNKFLMAQVEESARKSSAGRGSSRSGADTKSQHKIKHLEKLNENFKTEAQNAKSELAQKKKEILKYKQEANLLKTKLAESERKLAVTKKNAA